MRGMKLCAVGEGAQWNSASQEKTRSEIKRLRRRHVMNARHIGGDFAVTSSVLLYKLPIREGGAFPLTPPLPPPSLFPLHHYWSPFQLVAWGWGSTSPWSQSSPPQTLTVSWEVRGWGMRTVLWGGGGVRGQAPPSLMGSLYRNTEEVRAIYVQ
jgi:hypothetical protein